MEQHPQPAIGKKPWQSPRIETISRDIIQSGIDIHYVEASLTINQMSLGAGS